MSYDVTILTFYTMLYIQILIDKKCFLELMNISEESYNILVSKIYIIFNIL